MRKKMIDRISALLCALVLMLLFACYPIDSEALSFSSVLNLSDDASISSGQRLATVGNNTYVVWTDSDSGTILFANSTDKGESFGDPIGISEAGDFSLSPRIAAEGDQIYFAWVDNDVGNGDIFFRKGTIAEGALELENAINVSDSPEASSDPQLAVSAGNVYVAWKEDVSGGLDYGDILFAELLDGETNFDAPENLSNTASIVSQNAQLVASGDDVYMTWVEFDIDNTSISDVFFRKGSISGSDVVFNIEENLSVNLASAAQSPKVAVSGSNVIVVWDDAGLSDIFYAASFDGGNTFDDMPTDSTDNNLSGNRGSATPELTVVNDDVYIVWLDNTVGNGDISFVKGVVSGSTLTLDSARNLSDDAGFSSNSKLAISEGGDVYVVWEEDSPNDIFAAVSSDGGVNFGSLNLSSNADASASPQVSVSGTDVYVVWDDQTEGNGDILLRRIADTGPPSISIESVSDVVPRWGLDTLEISGLVNGNGTDTIAIDWDDGNTDSISVSGDSWGPVLHTYASTDIGTRSITASLLDELDVEKSSDSADVAVERHATSLTIEPIFSVIQGTSITATGILTDTDASAVISGKTITFNGTGASNLSSVLTQADGSYSSSGASPNSDAELLSAQAHFAQDAAYNAADSEIITYDTVETGSAQFNVLAGEPSGPVNLASSGFDASIIFESVLSDGVIYVSDCNSPSSPRYQQLTGDLCVKISSAVELESGSSANITISYNENAIPLGTTEDEIHIFREASSGIIDITTARNTIANTVTGQTTGFSKFIVGVAEYDAAPAGAVRQEVFVGDNDLIFEFAETKEISLGNTELTIGDDSTITVTDPSADEDSSVAETVTATVTSTSYPNGINVDLEETGANTGIFVGTFTLSLGSTSNPNHILHVEEGDEIRASYEEYTKSTFHVIIENVAEAGLAELVDYDAPTNSNFQSVGDAYELRLIEASLEEDANLTVTMSYENVDVSEAEELELDMFRMDGTICKERMNSPGTGINTNDKTVTGDTIELGQYTLAFAGDNPPGQCPIPGGAGGGIPRPGTGIVLDAVASVAFQSEETSHSGGGGKRTAVVQNNGKIVTTYPEPYFAINPLAKVQVEAFGNAGVGIKASVGEQIIIAGSFTNHQDKVQSYAYIVQIVDKDGFTMDVKFQTGSLQAGETATTSIPWMATDAGEYQVRIFVWDSVGEVPAALSEVATGRLEVSA